MGNLYLSVALVLFNLFKITNTNTSNNLEIYNISYLLFLYAVELDPLHRGDCLQ